MPLPTQHPFLYHISIDAIGVLMFLPKANPPHTILDLPQKSSCTRLSSCISRDYPASDMFNYDINFQLFSLSSNKVYLNIPYICNLKEIPNKVKLTLWFVYA